MSGDPPLDAPNGSDGTWIDRLGAAAIEAEFETGPREETAEQARRHVLIRMVRIVAGFTVIGMGVAALVLPGPGWVMIIVGLGLLPYAWAERTMLLIRRKVPGVPEHGTIPPRTWAVMGVLLVGFTTLSLLFGDDVTRWLAGLWGDPDRLLG